MYPTVHEIPCADAFDLCSSHSVKDQVSHIHKIMARITSVFGISNSMHFLNYSVFSYIMNNILLFAYT
jgi:polysaccharide deacetylase 2 family uncharacterized protein YibQ